MPEIETWKSIPSHPNYEASNFGRIRSITRMVNGKTEYIKYERKGCIKKPSVDSSGYNQVTLTNQVAYSLHRIIALCFIENINPELFTQVNHKNGIKTDNRVENLEWCTPEYNKLHALETGLIKRGSELSYSKLVLDLETGIFYDSISEAAIAKNIKGRTLHHWLFGDRKNNSNLILV